MSGETATLIANKLAELSGLDEDLLTKIDPHVKAALPPNCEIISVSPSGASAWVQTVRIECLLEDETIKNYFSKWTSGEDAQRMMQGSFESESAFHLYSPDHVPKPIAFGNYLDDSATWFYLCEFHDMMDEVPDPTEFVPIIVGIHKASMGKSPNGQEEQHSVFLKITTGPRGQKMVEGEFESMRLIHQVVPSFAPKPLARGTCVDPDRHFILFSFHDLKEGLPPPDCVALAAAQLHQQSHTVPHLGKFGFHITTYNGTLKQDNTWANTWEDFYIRGMVRMLELEEEAGGPCQELRDISKPFLEQVIPRLLRPLETGGRSITPVLIHGDLWIGNVASRKDTGEPMMFDASAFWRHNEYELSTMRPLDNDWGWGCLESYHSLIPKSEPQEDWDARNALYATRTYIHDSALYPKEPKFRQK